MTSSRFKKGVVLTMGTFDGVHRGHQAILKRTTDLARRRGLPSLAVTFHRPPRLFFFPPEGPSLLSLLSEKIELLKSFGIQHVEALRFGKSLARMSAEKFFERYFLRRYRVKEIVVGYNFGFGRDRQGDTRFLERHGAARGIPVRVVSPVTLQGVPISSEQIRHALRHGRLDEANRRLGYDYFVEGVVVRGDGRGRTLGFPTANLEVSPEKIVPPGVFAVRATLAGGLVRRGMCNVGTRPTLNEPRPRATVEVHLLDFWGNLVGKPLRLEFVKKIRAERRFDSWEALSRRLRSDERSARRALA
jgi:riboflavin kinase/FMN adenylyltransferase